MPTILCCAGGIDQVEEPEDRRGSEVGARVEDSVRGDKPPKLDQCNTSTESDVSTASGSSSTSSLGSEGSSKRSSRIATRMRRAVNSNRRKNRAVHHPSLAEDPVVLVDHSSFEAPTPSERQDSQGSPRRRASSWLQIVGMAGQLKRFRKRPPSQLPPGCPSGDAPGSPSRTSEEVMIM